MNRSKPIAVTMLVLASLGASASTGQPGKSISAVAAEPARQYAVAVPRHAPETSYAYLTEAAPPAQTVMARENPSKLTADKSPGETNALAMCAVGLLIAGFTILRRIN